MEHGGEMKRCKRCGKEAIWMRRFTVGPFYGGVSWHCWGFAAEPLCDECKGREQRKATEVGE